MTVLFRLYLARSSGGRERAVRDTSAHSLHHSHIVPRRKHPLDASLQERLLDLDIAQRRRRLEPQLLHEGSLGTRDA